MIHDPIRERALFEAALEQPASRRGEFLRAECGDESLRRRVERLLEAHERSGPALTAPLLEVTPQSIGPYTILGLLGEGGMGAVYEAMQETPVRRRVALKLIRGGMGSGQVLARFDSERQALAMMSHANIARVFDAGSTGDGRPYFAMEHIDGVPITEYCDRNRLSTTERLELFCDVCAGVQHAHQKGIIHRDIKPSNVLVQVEGDRPVPKIIDFGIAKATGANELAGTTVTLAGQLVGTPEYMSPEQVAMTDLDIDTRSDVYALGVLLYELLTGTTPFDSATLRRAGLAEIQHIIQGQDPPRPSSRVSRMASRQAPSSENARAVTRDESPASGLSHSEGGRSPGAIVRWRPIDLKSLSRSLRGDLDWIIMKALEKDKSRRYDTASGLAADIQRHLRDEPVVAGPPSTQYRLRKFIKRNRVGVLAGSLVAAALVLGIIGTTMQSARARRAADEAERAAYQAQMVSAASAVEDQRVDAARVLLAATAPRLRGWEYQHLSSRLDRSLPSPFPAEWRLSRFNDAAASGTLAIEKSGERGASQWAVLAPDLRTERFVLPGSENGGVSLSPDGSRAVWIPYAVGDQRPALLWNLDKKTLLATIPMQPVKNTDDLVLVTWTPAGDRFAVARHEGFEVFNGRTGSRLDRRAVRGLAQFTGDSRWMLLRGSRSTPGSDPRACRLLDARTFEPQHEVFHFESPMMTFGTSSWGSRLACCIEDGTVRLLDIVDGVLRERSRIPAGIGVLGPSAWSRDGRLVAVGSGTGRVRVWEADSGTLRGDFAGPQFLTRGMLFLPDSGDLLVGDVGGHHRVWPIRSAASDVLAAHRSFVYPTVISKDGGMLLTGGWDGWAGQSGGLKLWDARTGTLVAEYGRPGEIFGSADLSADGRYAVAGIWSEADSRTEIIDLDNGAVATTFNPPAKMHRPVRTIVHPDGHRVISRYPSGEVYVWDLVTGKVLWETTLNVAGDASTEHSTAAGVSPDGHRFALADGDLGIRIVNADTYAGIRGWDAHGEMIWSLAFSPDGEWLLSASSDDTIGVWEVATGTLIARLTGHNADVLCAVMSPDGTRIASGGRDGYVRLWDTIHFENVAQLGGHKDYIYQLAWSPGGRQLISGSGDSTVRIWDTRTLAEQVAAARARIDALPGVEARFARARADTQDPAAAVEAVIGSPQLGTRDRELVRQVAARFASRGAPAYYRAPRVADGPPLVIDGRLDEAAWSAAPWSEPFVDIEGDVKPEPRFDTTMRMLWDDEHLYIVARMEEPHVQATLTTRDDIIFNDNDFEVFVDPDGDGRWYGEVEVNALAAIFDLRLDRPYSEGATPDHDWSPPDLRAAVAIDGTLNDASDVDRGWTVEIAIPHSALAHRTRVAMPPRTGDVWRINFSRVEWQHEVVDGRYLKRPGTQEDNWVWTPQHVVNMHVPREWGFVEFVGAPNGE